MLLKIAAFLAGLHFIGRIDQELRREHYLLDVPLSVMYPGASPEELDESIIRRPMPATCLLEVSGHAGKGPAIPTLVGPIPTHASISLSLTRP